MTSHITQGFTVYKYIYLSSILGFYNELILPVLCLTATVTKLLNTFKASL